MLPRLLLLVSATLPLELAGQLVTQRQELGALLGTLFLELVMLWGSAVQRTLVLLRWVPQRMPERGSSVVALQGPLMLVQ
jgi:hypothetical protein